jgi:pilus assembly protein Flp/PilA
MTEAQKAVSVEMDRVRQDEEGQTLVEYSLILAFVSIALIGALTALTGGLNGVFDTITTALGV